MSGAPVGRSAKGFATIAFGVGYALAIGYALFRSYIAYEALVGDREKSEAERAIEVKMLALDYLRSPNSSIDVGGLTVCDAALSVLPRSKADPPFVALEDLTASLLHLCKDFVQWNASALKKTQFLRDSGLRVDISAHVDRACARHRVPGVPGMVPLSAFNAIAEDVFARAFIAPEFAEL